MRRRPRRLVHCSFCLDFPKHYETRLGCVPVGACCSCFHDAFRDMGPILASAGVIPDFEAAFARFEQDHEAECGYVRT